MPLFRPHPLLGRRVAAIEVLESAAGEERVLPSTSVVLGLQFRGRVRAGEALLATAGVTGLQGGARTYSYLGGTGTVLVRFTAQGASCLGVPVSELADRSVPLDALLPRARVSEAVERLEEAAGDRARVAVVEALLAELSYASDPVVARAIDLVGSSPDDASIAAVARLLGKSERQLERRFLARVGVTPKRFASLRRFERAAALAAAAPSLAAAAAEAGYYDQSHFIREVRRFAGAPPGEVFARPGGPRRLRTIAAGRGGAS